ncbi:MAG: ATP-binding protein [Anaerolineae bacterium]|nr:ATP-binding protein [Anaerolineae bacterium]
MECICEILPSGIKIILCDTGRPFKPEDVPKPDITSPLDERKKGGLGLFFIDQMMDEAKFEFTSQKNILVLVKYK